MHDNGGECGVVQKSQMDGRVNVDSQREIAGGSEREKEKKALIDKLKKSEEKKPEDKKPEAAAPPGQKPAEKKPEMKKPEEKKLEEKPKPPESTQTGIGANLASPAAARLAGGAL